MRATEFFLKIANIPSLTEQQRLTCASKMTSKECDWAMEPFNSTTPQEMTEFQLNFTKHLFAH